MLKMTLKRSEYVILYENIEIDRVNDEIFMDEKGKTVRILTTDEYGSLIFDYYSLGDISIYERNFYEENIRWSN